MTPPILSQQMGTESGLDFAARAPRRAHVRSSQMRVPDGGPRAGGTPASRTSVEALPCSCRDSARPNVGSLPAPPSIPFRWASSTPAFPTPSRFAVPAIPGPFREVPTWRAQTKSDFHYWEIAVLVVYWARVGRPVWPLASHCITEEGGIALLAMGPTPCHRNPRTLWALATPGPALQDRGWEGGSS